MASKLAISGGKRSWGMVKTGVSSGEYGVEGMTGVGEHCSTRAVLVDEEAVLVMGIALSAALAAVTSLGDTGRDRIVSLYL